jgi:hypothetical protein
MGIRGDKKEKKSTTDGVGGQEVPFPSRQHDEPLIFFRGISFTSMWKWIGIVWFIFTSVNVALSVANIFIDTVIFGLILWAIALVVFVVHLVKLMLSRQRIR